jgi:hypothetical protein
LARRVYVHVGAPKTGSTYVQNVLWQNRVALKRAGHLLPGSPAAHDQAMTDLRAVSWRDPKATWTWDKLVAKAARWPGDVIISNEGLGSATAEQAARAVTSLAPAEVHVIVAARDLWRTLPSMWQQGVRARSVGSFEAFLRNAERGNLDTPGRMLRRWGDQVPAARRHLVTVPAPGAPPDALWHRFAGITGIPDGLCQLPAPAVNPSLGAAEIEVLRHVNRALGERYPHRTPYQKVVQRHLVDAVLKQRGNEVRFGVGPDQAGWVADLAERQNRDLRAYPCRIVGDLAELQPAVVDGAVMPDDLDDSQVLATAIETIIGMLGHAESLGRQSEEGVVPVLSRLKRRAARTLEGGLRRSGHSGRRRA